MADCEDIEVGHAQKKGKGRERNWKDNEIEMLITLYEERPCLWDVGHKDYMNTEQTLSGPFFRIPSPSSSKHAIIYHTQSSYFLAFAG